MEKSDSEEQPKQVLAEYLRLHGLRNTPERFAILNAIYSIEGHFTPEMLVEKMADELNFRVCRATVYNNLELLVDAKLVHKHRFTEGAQYEKSFKEVSHGHLICTECGMVMEYDDHNVHRQIEAMRVKRFTISSYSLYVYGLCSKCSASLKRKQKKILNKIEKQKNGRKKD